MNHTSFHKTETGEIGEMAEMGETDKTGVIGREGGKVIDLECPVHIQTHKVTCHKSTY